MGETDLIDRQAAIDALKAHEDYKGYLHGDFEEILEALPSAPPKKVCVAEVKVEIDEIKDYIDKAINAERWIPCSERLPEVNGRYLVTRGLNACGSLWNRIYIANYSDLMGLKSERIWWNGNVGKSDFERIDDVIAWMTLPDPYKEEER